MAALFDGDLYRIVVSTSDTSAPQLGGDGDSCRWALDCESGFCLANKCTVACTGSVADECGLGRRCQAFSPPGLETKVCVTECDEAHPCAEGFCLRDDPVTQDEIKASGFCVKGGPLANTTDCRRNYHTICASGYCSACDSDPLGCDSPGTCQAP